MANRAQNSLRGALAGTAATLPMSLFMLSAKKLLPSDEKYPLPPREIEEVLAQKTRVDTVMDETDHSVATALSHFGYGAACGALYGLFVLNRSRNKSEPASVRALKGTAFGLGVWSVSYLVLLPTLRILKPATDHPPRRNALMIVAHVIWGASLGLLAPSAKETRATRLAATLRARALNSRRTSLKN